MRRNSGAMTAAARYGIVPPSMKSDSVADEVIEADDDDCSTCSDCDSELESRSSRSSPMRRASFKAKETAFSPSANSSENSLVEVPASSSPTLVPAQIVSDELASAAPVAGTRPQSAAATSGSRQDTSRAPIGAARPILGPWEMIAKLREENTRLRLALVKTQRDNETLAQNLDSSGDGPQNVSSDVDISHILALARELNDGIGTEGDEADCSRGSAQVFAMDDSEDEGDDDISVIGEDKEATLRRQLENARGEIATLKARDIELRSKFHVLWSAVCGGPVADDGDENNASDLESVPGDAKSCDQN